MTCDESKAMMVEALYDELEEAARGAFQEHLASCADCRAAYRGLEQTLGIMNLRQRPEPDEAFWRTFWLNLRGRLAVVQRPADGRHLWRPAALPAWAYGIAAVLLLATGIYLGRTIFLRTAPQQQPPAVAVSAPMDSTETAALAYLGRTKNLLLDLVNAGQGHEAVIDLGRRQEISRQLLEQSAVLKVSLTKPDQQQLRQLIRDLEIVLMQLANLEVKPGVPAVELVRRGVDQKSILLKINLEELRAMARREPTEEPKSKL